MALRGAKELGVILLSMFAVLFVFYSWRSEQVVFEEDIRSVETMMSTFRKIDAGNVGKVLKLDIEHMSEDAARESLYNILSRPVQGVCRILKRFGGVWLKSAHVLDGDKFVCMDKLRSTNSGCLIYSFGINNEWSFEDMITKFGCEIYAYDHTIRAPPNRGENIHFIKKGIDTVKTEKMNTLDAFIEQNNHKNRTISYLKVDVEAAELKTFPQWIKKGTLQQVDQIALEFHLTALHNQNRFKELLQAVKDMYLMGFRLISYEPNSFAGPKKIKNTGSYYRFFEIVFMKDNVWNSEDQ